MTTDTTANDERIDLGMMCSCGDERGTDVAALIARATARIEAGDMALAPRAVAPARFVTELLLSLSVGLDRGITITSIAADQWFGIRAQEDGGTTYGVQCDEVEGGLAQLYLVARARSDERTLATAMSAAGAGLSEEQVAATLVDGFDYTELLAYRATQG